MALKRKINKAAFEKLSDELKKEYRAGTGDDEFILDTEGDEDTGALKRAKDREKQRADEALAKLAEVQADLDAIQGDDARKTGDIKTLEKSWQKKLEDSQTAANAKNSKLTATLTKSLVDGVASSIAHKISNAPSLLLPHIKNRLMADFEGDEPATRVLDKDGKPSALTIEELTAELVANKEFSAIITASKASGGATKPNNQSGGGATKDQQNPPNLAQMKPADLAAQIKANKAAAQT